MEIQQSIEAGLKELLPVSDPKKSIGLAGGGGFDPIDEKDLTAAYLPAEALLAGGGKRWRPLLAVYCCGLCGKEPNETVLRLAVLPEAVHNGTLIIDDIEDGAVLRRGAPCAHIRFGTDAAVNSGNLLYFLPTVLIDTAGLSDSQKLGLYQIYSLYMRRVHFGQALDIEWHKTDKIPSEEAYFQMCRLKTGSLAAMAAQTGVFLGGGTESQRQAAAVIAENIGVFFQIIDDVINLRTGNKGKNRGDDIVERKKSLPVLYYCRRNDPAPLLRLMKTASERGYADARAEIAEAVSLILADGADKEAEKTALALRDETAALLRKSFPASEFSRRIEEMIDGFFREVAVSSKIGYSES